MGELKELLRLLLICVRKLFLFGFDLIVCTFFFMSTCVFLLHAIDCAFLLTFDFLLLLHEVVTQVQLSPTDFHLLDWLLWVMKLPFFLGHVHFVF